MNHKQDLLAKLNNKTATIGIVGLGYVGLPLILRFSEVGFPTLGFDVDQGKVDGLNAGESYIAHIPSARIATARQARFEATTDMARAAECDALILCVPTPLDKHREPDMSFIVGTVASLKPHLRAGQAVSLESTTYPGTTEEIILPAAEESNLVAGRDVFLIYSPEREDPGNAHFNTRTIPKVVGGHTPACLEVGQALYEQAIDKIVPVSSTRTAEMVKLLENIHRAVNIGLVNELKIVADRMGIDIYEVIAAAATKPFGFTPYYPGPGFGGHCIPIDPYYLTWKAREYGVNTRFIELAGEVNRAMPGYVVEKLTEGLNDQGKALKSRRILVLGIAYKKNVGDMRESPAVKIMELLRAKGAQVAYADPHVLKFPPMREHRFDLESVTVTAETLRSYDAVVVATAHDAFDYDVIRENASLVIDSRGVYRKSYANVIKA